MAFSIAASPSTTRPRRCAPCKIACSAQPPAPLYVREANPDAKKRTAVLVHDFLTDGRLFALLAREPSLADTRLVAVDLRGHGRSPRPRTAYRHADDLRDVAMTRSDGKVHLVGGGLGGIHALEAAAGMGDDGWIQSIALFGSGLPGHKWREEDFLNVTDARRTEDVDEFEDEAEIAGWVKRFIGANEAWKEVLKNSDKTVVASLKKMVREYSGYHFREMDLEIRPGNGIPLSERLEHITVPVLAGVGERDTADFKTIAQEILNGVANPWHTDPIVVAGAGHFPSLENPREVGTVLARFWNSLETTSGKMVEQHGVVSDQV